MKTATEPLKFFSHLKWLDGRPLLDVVELYRQRIFTEALYTLDAEGVPKYNLVLAGRAKKCWKSADLVLAALYRLLAWSSPLGNQCYILANDKGQANDDLELARKIIKANKVLRDEVKVGKDIITRRDGDGFLEILPAQDVSGAHGKTALFLGFDEIHGSAYRTYDLFEALALDPHRLDALMWITSYASLYNRKGIPLYDLFQKGKEGKDPRMFFSWFSGDYVSDPLEEIELGDTPEAKANPSTLPEGYLTSQKSRLPAHRYRRLHLNMPGAPEGAFLDGNVVEAAIGTHKILPYQTGLFYRAFVDMSGGTSDDATLAIAHAEEGRTIVDGIWNQGHRPPFDTSKAITLFASILKTYNISKVTGDNYAGDTHKNTFVGHGIAYEPCPLPKSALYEVLEVELNSGRVVLPDEETMLRQLLQLVLKGAKIDHPSGEHDDFANGVAGAVYVAKAVAPMTKEQFREGSMTISRAEATARYEHEGGGGDDYIPKRSKPDPRWDW